MVRKRFAENPKEYWKGVIQAYATKMNISFEQAKDLLER